MNTIQNYFKFNFIIILLGINLNAHSCPQDVKDKEITIYRGDALSTTNKEQINKYKEISWSKHVQFTEEKCMQRPLEKILLDNNVPLSFEILVVGQIATLLILTTEAGKMNIYD